MTGSSVWGALDRQSRQEGGMVVVTGAAGWAGRTLLQEILEKTSIHERDALVALGRRASTIRVGTHSIALQPHSALADLHQPVTLFAPLAFLTRDRVNEFGPAAYMEENLTLISESLREIGRLRPSRVISISSGAASADATGRPPSVTEEPYGFLKNVEEWGLTHECTRLGLGLTIGRLWGASGQLMPIARQYALSDFIMQARVGGPVHVRSANAVYRRYVDMSQFLEVLVGLSVSGEPAVLDSGGALAEIGEVARLVASDFGVEVTRGGEPQSDRDDYCPDPTSFETAARSLGIELLSLPAQVARTIHGHTTELNGGSA